MLAAAALSFSVLDRWAPRLVSYAVGVLLGAAFLDLLPEAVNALGPEDVLRHAWREFLLFSCSRSSRYGATRIPGRTTLMRRECLTRTCATGVRRQV